MNIQSVLEPAFRSYGRVITGYQLDGILAKMQRTPCPVSYTHLDVYKRQELTRANQIEVVKAYSKEIEYSEQNIEALAEASLEHPAFLRENLLAAIMW